MKQGTRYSIARDQASGGWWSRVLGGVLKQQVLDTAAPLWASGGGHVLETRRPGRSLTFVENIRACPVTRGP